jgi:RNA polymerase sigma-70 factor (ECF subfamily)
MTGVTTSSEAARRAFDVARAPWGAVLLDPEEFLRFLEGHHLAPEALPDAVLPDLYLACACAKGSSAALRAFTEVYTPVVAGVARRFDRSPAFLDDVAQRVNQTLFVDGQLKIALYKGQGTLAAFVSTTARRIAFRMVSGVPRFHGEELLLRQFADVDDHETALLKERCRDVFNRALLVALRQLPRRDRLILRMNIIEQVSTAKIGAMYKVSQPTVSRWIQRSARQIFITVKDLLRHELDVDTQEVQSIFTLVRSRLDIGLSQATADGGGRTDEDQAV